MNQNGKTQKKNAKGQWLRVLPLILALVAASTAAMAEEGPGPSHAETVMEPMTYYSNLLTVSAKLVTPTPTPTPTPTQAEGVHTVNYYLQEPVSGTWMPYFTEERAHGRLAGGPLYNPIDPAGNYERVFTGWYEDEAYTLGPVNLLRMPVTADMNLYARFGGEEEVFQPENFEAVITFTPRLSLGGVDAASETPEPIPQEVMAAASAGGKGLPENLVATITAQIEGVPEGVYYTLQWQNDLSGELADVPGETGNSVTFPATQENLNCMWRLALVF